MNLDNLQNKKIAILGLGVENYALVLFLLKKKIDCEITVCDRRDKKGLGERYTRIEGDIRECRLQGVKVKWRLGKNYDKELKDFDVIFRIAGYPLFTREIKKAKKAGAEITSPIKLFFELCPSRNIIGVTGTKGKGTTASLIYVILKNSGKRAHLAGNIGTPVFEILPKIKKDDWVVLELSSFQLEDSEKSPHIAVVTNFYLEHLAPADPNNPNFHKSLAAYRRAKLSIIRYQKRGDFAVVNKSLATGHWPLGTGKHVRFGKSNLPSKLIGEHNKENIAAAVEVAKLVGIKKDGIDKAVAKFMGLEHRLELVRSLDGVKYYDDSFATTPEAAMTALKSFESGRIVLIAGGADKGSDFRQMMLEVNKRCKAIILLEGEGTDKMIQHSAFSIQYSAFNDFKKAIIKARAITDKGDVVLLSPGCASFGMFRNYKERGELFKKYVMKLE